MKMKIRIDLEPRAKGRPKTHFINGNAITYTPKRTVEAEDFIKASILQYRDCALPAHTPVKLIATFYRHKSKWLKGEQKREVVPVRKPDLDNMVKLLLDSINTILLPDDAQITSMDIKKRWTTNKGKDMGYIEFELVEDKDVEFN
jgi:Holliday junction resolvase RusA-like endonuclease